MCHVEGCDLNMEHRHCRWCSGPLTTSDHWWAWEHSVCAVCFDLVLDLVTEAQAGRL